MVKKVMAMFVDSDVRVSINLNVRDLYDREMIKVIFGYLDGVCGEYRDTEEHRGYGDLVLARVLVL